MPTVQITDHQILASKLGVPLRENCQAVLSFFFCFVYSTKFKDEIAPSFSSSLFFKQLLAFASVTLVHASACL